MIDFLILNCMSCVMMHIAYRFVHIVCMCAFIVCMYHLCMRMKYRKEDNSANGVEIKDMMDTWTLQMGYPVVTVRRSGSQISATQDRFLYLSHGNFTEEFTSPYGLILYFVENSVEYILVIDC